MKIHSATSKNIKKAASIIRAGGLVAFPTETVYGLGADAFNPYAVARIFAVKKRPFFDPLIVHIGDFSLMKQLCGDIPSLAERLMRKFWPGPLTFILPKQKTVPGIVTAGLPTIAVRMPSHPVALAFLKKVNIPIAAPSANPFGSLSPTEAVHVTKHLGEAVDIVLDGGRCPVGVESTIIDLTAKKPVILRHGALPLEEIEQFAGKMNIHRGKSKPVCPGSFRYHYAPRTKLKLLSCSSDLGSDLSRKRGLLAFKAPKNRLSFFQKIEVLSPAGDLHEAAANLFSCLHKLDEEGLDVIYAEPVPEAGLGRAIMDRLRKAAQKTS